LRDVSQAAIDGAELMRVELGGVVRRGDADDVHAGRSPRPDPRRRVLEDDAVGRRGAQLAGGEQVALGIGLAARQALGRDQHGWHGQADGAQARGGQRDGARGHDRDRVGAGEELVSAGQGDDALDIVGLAQVDRARLGRGVELRRQRRDDLARRPALLHALDRLGGDAMRRAPPAPGAHDRRVRVDEDAVEIGEDRGHAATDCGSRTTAVPARA
jgi:hypothetical protein